MAKHVVLGLIVVWLAYGQAGGPVPAFEVASVKVAPPPDPNEWRNSCGGGPGTRTPGSYKCENATLATLLTAAYGLMPYQIPEPAKSDSVRYNIDAKIPDGATRAQVTSMLRNLLTARFKLTFHFETKEMRAFDLTVAKGGPRFKEATTVPPPSPNTNAGRDADGFLVLVNGPGTYLSVADSRARITGSNTTLQRLVLILVGQLGAPVTDSTGLTGKYDFVLTFTRAVTPSAAATADAPELAPSIFDAVQSQLGLKLEQKKSTIDVIVIDHFDVKPLEN